MQIKIISYIISYTIICFSIEAFGQNTQSTNCQFIELLLNNSKVQNDLGITRNRSDTIFIVDSGYFFSNCNTLNVNNSFIEIIRKTKGATKYKYSQIHIIDLQNVDYTYKLFIGYWPYKRYGFAEFEKKDGKLILKKYQMGEF